MRTLNIFSTVLIGLLVFSSCSKDEMGPVASSNPGSPSITAPESGQSYTLSENQAEDTLLTMEWTEPDYGFPSATSFTIQMDVQEQDFSDPMKLATVNSTSYSVTVGGMNSQMLGAGLPFGQETALEFRVVASVSDSMGQQISEPITLAFTPYSVCQYCPEIYVPGGYQAVSGYGSNWTPADAPALSTVDGGDVYEGYVYMANDNNQFKFTAERNWGNGDWGDDNADGSLDPGGANIEAANGGYYKVDVDLNSLTYLITDTQWGLIGSATANEWDSDQDMTYDPQAKVWTITTDLSSGEMKFRANDDWAINYGDNGADGTLEQDGANIAIDSGGNYTIELDLSSDPYTYSVTQN